MNKNEYLHKYKNLALNKGGECISNKYINSHTKLQFKCKNNHIWFSEPSNILAGKWCAICANNVKFSIESVKIFANTKNGKCLSTQYINTNSPLEWKCEFNHQWKATFGNIKSGKWCPSCNKLSIKEMREIAASHYGNCISDKYVNCYTKLKWECSKKHIWEALPQNIKAGTWCGLCSKSKTENLCRKVFEEYFGKSFNSEKPNWLLTDQGRQMELDGFNKELQIAFEYNGEQHYFLIKDFSSFTEKELKAQIIRDARKVELCEKFGVKLFVIKYIQYPTNKEKVKKVILNILKENGFK